MVLISKVKIQRLLSTSVAAEFVAKVVAWGKRFYVTTTTPKIEVSITLL